MEYEPPTDNQQQSKSVNCKNLPDNLVIDKKSTRAFFSKFGSIKRIIIHPKKRECTVEFNDFESAQRALKYQDDNLIMFATPEKIATPEPDFIDPDVQSELDLMSPVGARPLPKQGIENFMRNPQHSMMKPRLPPAPRQKTEPLSVSVNADPRLVNIARNELENLAKKPARSAEEKLQILDARDKLYRLINAKTTDISVVTSMKGTCKDMCPEKERLMREARLQVASFETGDDGSSMDAKKSIKQYSRSAADAESPLPHELRPEASLKTTMTYLLHNIMNLCDDDSTSIGDWFHFVWDRTRGIRKDITQQELCSPGTVELVEQCVRFHIHCAARLIAEDPSIFDQKINTENLTKCLQTLKYMYNDLKLKGISSPNEAEFRAYVVLLNLNESGNFLWEIKQLDKSILNSQEIRFALDVYFAIANNNYVKFFNLIREASYMGACILLRYFTQVRMRAINIIMGSYTPRKVGFNFSISYLSDILAFEDFETTVTFLQHHGLSCSPEEDIVYLDRTTFGHGETPYQMERCFNIVESKMESTVAEAVCGGPLPSPDCFLKHEPHSSFDNDGFLKRESFYAEDQNGPSKESLFKVPKGSPPVSPSRSMFAKQENSMAENPFYKSPPVFAAQKIQTNIFGSQKDSPNPFATRNSFNVSPSTSIFGPPVKPDEPKEQPKFFGTPKPQVCFGAPPSFSNEQPQQNFGFSFKQQEEVERKKREEKLAQERRIEEERIREEEKRLQKEREELARLQAAAEKKRREEEEQREREAEIERKRQEEIALQKSCEEVLDSLINEVVKEKVRVESEQSVALFVKLPEDFYDVLEYDVVASEICKIYRQEFLAYVNQTKLKYTTMFEFFQKWRKTTHDEVRRREKLSTIGCSILNSSLEQQAISLQHPEQSATLSNMKQYLSGSPQTIVLPDMNRFKTINLFEELKVKESEKIFWKFIVSIPHKNEEKCLGFSSFINKWLSKTFVEQEKEPPSEEFFLEQKLLKGSRTKLAICIRKVRGSTFINEKGEVSPSILDNSHGVLFLTTSTNLPASRKRLQNILNRLELPTPVTIIVYKNQFQASDEDDLSRHFDLSSEPNVASFEITIYYECHEKTKNLTQVTLESCQFLIDCHQPRLADLNDLQSQHVLDFFQLTIGDEMWKRVELSSRQSDRFWRQMRRFNGVVHLLNRCLDKLMEVVTNDFKKLPAFPKEFTQCLPPMIARIPQSFEYFPEDWKSEQRQKQQISFIHDLKLLKMQNDEFKTFDDFKEKLMKFLTANLNSHKDKVFQSVVAKVVDFLYRQNLSDEDEVAQALGNFCWLQVLGEVVVGKFNEIYQRRLQDLPSAVIYQKLDLQRYKDVPWWFKLDFPVAVDHCDEPQRKKTKIVPPTNSELEAILKKSANSLSKLSDKIASFKEVSSKTRESSKDFDKYLLKFEEKFKAWEEKFSE